MKRTGYFLFGGLTVIVGIILLGAGFGSDIGRYQISTNEQFVIDTKTGVVRILVPKFNTDIPFTEMKSLEEIRKQNQ